MSKITIHGIELEMNMLRATDNERISKAIASAGAGGRQSYELHQRSRWPA